MGAEGGWGAALPGWRLLTGSAGLAPAATSIAGYSACSVTMVLVNKALAMLPACRQYRLSLLPVVMQAISAVFLLVAWEAVCAYRQLSLERPGSPKRRRSPADLSRAVAARVHERLWPGWGRFLRCVPCAVSFAAMLLTGFLALSGVSVPFMTVGKNTSNVLTALGEYLLLGYRPGRGKRLALALMLLGALAAAWHDLTFVAGPYCWLALNCAATSAYVLMMRVLSLGGKELPGREASIAINNVLCIALLLPAAWYTGEIQRLVFREGIQDSGEEPAAFFSFEAVCLHSLAGLCAFLLNFATMRCVALTSATTYAMVGAANKLPIALLGFLIWRVPVSREGFVSVSIGLCSALLYALQ